MGRGSSGGKASASKKGGGGNIAVEKAISNAEKDLNYSSVGASFSKLDKSLQNRINSNLKPTDTMKEYLRDGNLSINDEWQTGFAKNKITVISSYKDGQINFTIKKRNKILLRDADKKRAANNIAKFYLDNM